MDVAVTGATGFIGRNVVEHLVRRGIDVRAIVRPRSAPIDLPADIVTSRLERSPLAQAFRGVHAVVHLAGVVDAVHERDFFQVNAEGTRAVAEAALEAGAHLVHISSLSVAGPATADMPSREDDEPRPMTSYGRSKLESERIVKAMARLRWTILRPAIVYGPYDRALLPLFKWARVGLLPLVGPADGAYTFVHASDVASAIESAVSGKALGQTVFVGHAHVVRTGALLSEISRAMGTRARTVRIPRAAAWVAAAAGEFAGRALGRRMPMNYSRLGELLAPGFVCRVDRMQQVLGVHAGVGLEEGLARTAAWYRSAGWL